MTTKQRLTAHELACAAKYILDNVTDDTAVFAATRLLSVALQVDGKGAAMDRAVHETILHPRYKRICNPNAADRQISNDIIIEVRTLFKGAQS